MNSDQHIEIDINGESVTFERALLEKYNKPGPRYTSYPTAPEWNDNFGESDWLAAIEETRDSRAPLSLYVHLPFCETLCLFCGCNVVINKNHEVSVPYLDHLFQEIDRLSERIDTTRPVEQLHWGGGTPTYLTAGQIERLFAKVASKFTFTPGAELGIEIEPRTTSEEQCRTLRRLGFNRLSMGVQDFDPLVQKTINRIQPYDMTKRVFDQCRALGFDSINVDLIYGLPHQTVEGFSRTVDRIMEINPDRIALFSYAHVPWLKKQQGSFARHLPEGFEKFRIFHCAIQKLTAAGYRYIGMDHFARPADELCRAQDDRTLYRNFQGYTTKAGCDLFAAGVSSISSLEYYYAQNWRDLEHYYQAIDAGQLPIMRGIRITEEDRLRRAVINRILCHGTLIKSEVESEFGIDFNAHFAAELEELRELEADKLVRLSDDRIEVATLGRIFMRNVAMVFDARLKKEEEGRQRVFSKTL
ncbi:MAG: oxygen-independent coproporphyrinogen III oxidase [Acidobacteriota bacterium]|nr:MAG: oxygen-independent coproporphyrinogen III oxidase [Acidobacteriota bacterium]